MAGIGQRFSSSNPTTTWNSPAQFSMGRKPSRDTSPTSLQKPFMNSFHSPNSEKRNLGFQENGDASSLFNAFGANRGIFNPAYPSSSEKDLFHSSGAFGGSSLQPRNGESSSLTDAIASSAVSQQPFIPSRMPPFQGMDPSSSSNLPINPFLQQQHQSRSPFPSGTRGPGLYGMMGSGVPGSNSNTSTLTFDPSEFPSLGTGNRAPSQSSQANYVNVIAKGVGGIGPGQGQPITGADTGSGEFTIQQEDFPALPGTQNPPRSSSATSAASLAAAFNGPPSTAPSIQRQISVPNSTNNNAFLLPPQSQTPESAVPSHRIQLHANSLVSNIPPSMIRDPFGMVGLVKLMKVGETEPTLNLLAPGIDLTVLGLNMTQQNDIHNTFVSPWHESCMGRCQDMDYPVPSEYQIRHLIADTLPEPKPEDLPEETLFWIFYNCTREESQLCAAKELYNKEWRFNKTEQKWLKRAPNTDSTQPLPGGRGERGVYLVWDPVGCTETTQALTIYYADLDSFPANCKSARLTFGLPEHHPRPAVH